MTEQDRPNTTRQPLRYLSRQHSLECIAALLAALGLLGVLYTFVIGRHFLIPTVILAPVIILANLAWFGFKGQVWAKHFLFWACTLLACHGFFALFWAKKYREVLGSAFEPLVISLVVVLVYLLVEYVRRNKLWGKVG